MQKFVVTRKVFPKMMLPYNVVLTCFNTYLWFTWIDL